MKENKGDEVVKRSTYYVFPKQLNGIFLSFKDVNSV